MLLRYAWHTVAALAAGMISSRRPAEHVSVHALGVLEELLVGGREKGTGLKMEGAGCRAPPFTRQRAF